MKLPSPLCTALTATAVLSGSALLGASPAFAAIAVPHASAVTAANGVGATGRPEAAPAAWQKEAVPSTVKAPATLASVSAVSASQAWAVGAQAETALEKGTPLILSWNGTAWSKVALSGVAAPGYLTSVSAASATDAWAVGSDKSGAVVLHWNGTKWASVKFPDSSTATVDAVATGKGTTAWLVGSIPATGTNTNTLVEKWNGTAWKVVKTSLGGGHLDGVSVSASGDVWVGGANNKDQAVVGYEAAGKWKRLTTPGITNVSQVLGVSTTDVWAAGDTINSTAGVFKSLVCQWNGSTWTTVNTPASVLGAGVSISADGSGQPQWVGTDAVASGSTATTFGYYDGSAWSNVSGATTLGGAAGASAVTAHIPGTDATWAVGGLFDYSSGNVVPANPLIEYDS